MAYVTAPDGTPGEVPDERAQAALAAGYKPRQPTEAEVLKKQAAEQPLQAAGEGFLRGASFGVSDPLLKTLGGGGIEGVRKTASEMKARKEENPWAAGVSEVGGAVTTSLATGGGASALAGGGLRGAVVEGGLYGMGSMVSEAALENREATVDRLAAGMVGGALGSGVAHGGFSLLGKGVSAVTSKFGGKGLKETLGGLADSVESRALNQAGGAKWARNNEQYMPELLKFGREKGILGKASSAFDEATAQKAQSVASEHASKIASQMDDLESKIPLKGNDQLRMRVVNGLEKTLDDEFGNNPVFDEAVNGVKKMTNRLAEEPNLTWPELWEFQSSLFKDVPVTGLSPASQQVRETTRKALRDLVFDDVAEAASAAGQLPAGFGGMMRATGREARKAMALSKAITNGAYKVEQMGTFGGGTNFSLGGLAGMASGNVAPVIGGLLGDAAKVQIRKRGGLMGGAALRAISESRLTNGISNGLGKHIGNILAVAPEVLGAYRYPLSVAAAQGADALVQEHLRLASSEQGQDYLSKVGLPVEDEREVDSAGQRLAVLDALEAATQAHVEEMDSAVAGLFGSAPGRKGAIGSTMSPKEFKVASASIESILKDPNTAFEQVPAELRAGAPATATEAAAKLVQIAQFLDSKLPKSPFAGMPAALAPPWSPSPADLDKFNRYRVAVESPAQVLKNMARGLISPEQTEALQAVYPAMYADLRQKITERLMQQKNPLPYQQRVALAAIIGPQALGLSQQQVMILQQSQQPPPPDGAGGNGGGGATKGPDGRQDVGEEGMATEAQKLENR